MPGPLVLRSLLKRSFRVWWRLTSHAHEREFAVLVRSSKPAEFNLEPATSGTTNLFTDGRGSAFDSFALHWNRIDASGGYS